MKNVLKKISLITSSILFTSAFSASTHADFASNDSKNLMQCRGLVKAEFGDFDHMKTSNIKSKARSFSMRFKVSNNGERSVIQCKLKKNETASVTCLKGSACDGRATAYTEKLPEKRN